MRASVCNTFVIGILAAWVGAAPPIIPVTVVGLSEDNTLIHFTADRPGEIRSVKIARVSGQMLGLDYRPADRRLYGVTSTNNLYVLDIATGAAKLVCSLTIPFDGGGRAGVDFNPDGDRLRIVGGNGQNLRVHPDIGAAAADGVLRYVRKDLNFGKTPLVTAVAYTNSIAGANETKTFVIDAALDILARQEPPNDGTLQTVGPLGVDFDAVAGFDIHTAAQGSDHAFAVSASRFYAINLETGAATLVGPVGTGNLRMIGLAVVPVTPVRSAR